MAFQPWDGSANYGNSCVAQNGVDVVILHWMGGEMVRFVIFEIPPIRSLPERASNVLVL